MRTRNRLLALVATGALAVGCAALAQGETGGAVTGGGMTGGAMTGGAVTGGAQRMQETSAADIEQARMALSDVQAQIGKIQALSSISTADLKFVDVSSAVQPRNQATGGATGGAQTGGATGGQATGGAAERAQGMDLTGLIAQNQDQIDQLRQAIEANSAMQEALETQNIDIQDVVAVDVADDGQVTVYFAELEPPESEGIQESQPETAPDTGGGDTGGAETGGGM